MIVANVILLAAYATALALPPIEVDLEALLVPQTPHQKPVPCHPLAVPEAAGFSSPQSDEDDDSPLPVIVWHGLGDSSNADGLKDLGKLIEEVNPGTYVHLISATGNPDDRSASFFGNLTEQLELVCAQIAKDPILSTAPAIDAVGFSQGGQFLRGYIEKCNAPKVRSLITFGSQHNGITQFQNCKSATDFVCHAANAILKSSTVWSDYVQSHLVPAQYYRDTADYENYLEHSNFLADINNERKVKNATYKDNLSSLENFVMVLFKDDLTVIPKESSWFASKNVTTGNVTRVQDRKIYKEDWIGLKALDKKGALIFEEVKGEHMQLNDKDLTKLFSKYLGPMKSKKATSKIQELLEREKNVLQEWFDSKLDL